MASYEANWKQQGASRKAGFSLPWSFNRKEYKQPQNGPSPQRNGHPLLPSCGSFCPTQPVSEFNLETSGASSLVLPREGE
jgi:hypothetical protein